MEQLLFLLLLKKDTNKLFKFYWKKETQMLSLQIRLLFIVIFNLLRRKNGLSAHISKTNKNYLFIFSFLFPFFFIYLCSQKEYGGTALDAAAAFEGHHQIVQLLLEKGKLNVNSQRKVFLYSFFILYLFFIQRKYNFEMKHYGENAPKMFQIALLASTAPIFWTIYLIWEENPFSSIFERKIQFSLKKFKRKKKRENHKFQKKSNKLSKE